MEDTTRIEPVVIGQREYEAQGGSDFKFWNKIDDTLYTKTSVHQYEQLRRSFDKKVKQIEEFEEALKEALAAQSIDAELAQSFADIFGISLKREYEFTVTAEFTFTVEAGMENDVDSLFYELEFSVLPSDRSDVEIGNEDYTVTGFSYAEVSG